MNEKGRKGTSLNEKGLQLRNWLNIWHVGNNFHGKVGLYKLPDFIVISM